MRARKNVQNNHSLEEKCQLSLIEKEPFMHTQLFPVCESTQQSAYKLCAALHQQL